MSTPEPVPAGHLGSVPLSAPKTRIVTTALDLFSRHGVGGTSLQMIADAVGVTKAAVYHQFKTKDEIVVAAVESELAHLEGALDAAEAHGRGRRALETLLTQIIELAVARRRMVSNIQHDPVVVRLLAEHAPFQEFMQRLFRVLVGDEKGADVRVKAAMITTAIGGAVTHPLVASLDDETLRAQLVVLTQRFLDLPA